MRLVDTIIREGKPPVRVIQQRSRATFGLDCDGKAEITVDLPFPPGVNNLYLNINGRGRILTPRYRDWQAEAAGMILQQRPGRMFGEFDVAITLTRPDKRKRDIDGLIKAILDALVKSSVVQDDSLAESVSIAWIPGITGARVKITKIMRAA